MGELQVPVPVRRGYRGMRRRRRRKREEGPSGWEGSREEGYSVDISFLLFMIFGGGWGGGREGGGREKQRCLDRENTYVGITYHAGEETPVY